MGKSSGTKEIKASPHFSTVMISGRVVTGAKKTAEDEAPQASGEPFQSHRV